MFSNKKQALLVDVTVLVGVAAVLWLQAKAVYWTDSKTFAKRESFTPQNMLI